MEENDFPANPKAFLAAMTRNIAKDCWKKESRHFSSKIESIAEHIQGIISEEDMDDYSEELDAMKSCLEKIPGKSQELIRVHYFGGQSVKEIAIAMNMKTEAIYQALFRLRTKLRKCIEQSLKGENNNA